MTSLLVFSFGIGFVAGLRSMTAPAIVAWAVHLGRFDLTNSSLSFMNSRIALILFSILAIFELIGDKLPQTPKRTAILPLIARIVMGALCGATLCAAMHQSLGIGAALGAIGALIGAFAGYAIRKRAVAALGIKDFLFAICEDLVAIGLATL